MSIFKIRNKDGTYSYGYDFRDRVSRKRIRKIVPLARTKWQAEQAEKKAKEDLFNERYGLEETGTDKIGDFLREIYMPWSKANKRSWINDHYNSPVIHKHFGAKTFREVSPLDVERFKLERSKSNTRKDKPRAPATVNREFELLSRIFTLAIELKRADFNPCKQVKKFRLDNKRYRYLLPEEEPVLFANLDGKKGHLRDLIVVALGTGMRKNEQLSLKWQHVDFARNLIIVTKTKSGKDRDVPMNRDVRAVMTRMRRKASGDYVFINPKTKTRYVDIKKAFIAALDNAGIVGLVWHDLRATFGTRLGEAGYDAYTIAYLMGHSDIQTTARYVRATDPNKRAAVESARLDSQKDGQILVRQAKRPLLRVASK